MQCQLITPPTIEPMISKEREPKRSRQSGIYQIICKPTGKVYVGSAVWLAKRKRHHREALLAGRHHSQYLQKAWNKYGPDAFEFLVLEYCEKENLTEREQFYIDLFKSADPLNGFNLQPKAHSNLGMTMSPEAREKLSAGKKGTPCQLSPMQIEELRERMKGNVFSVGRKHSEEAKAKMKIARQGRTPSLGMRHSDSVRMATSERFKGITLSEEHKLKISLAHRGKKQTFEHRRNLALVQSKIKPDQAEQIRVEYIPGVLRMRDLASRYGCCAQTICNIINGKRTACL